MADAFPSMESFQCTIATSAKIIEQVSNSLEKSSIPIGISLGGTAIEWNRLLSDNNKIAGRITIAANPDTTAAILSEPYNNLMDNPQIRRNSEIYRESFSLENVPAEAFKDTGHSTVILGSEDKVFDINAARAYYERLGIKPHVLPFGHATLLTEGIPTIPLVIQRSLKEIKEHSGS
jgi:hypothetical protein